MSPSSPDVITLTTTQRDRLAHLVRAGTTSQRLVTRARIVLAAGDQQPNTVIAQTLEICDDTVRKWRHRWAAEPGIMGRRAPLGSAGTLYRGAGRAGQGAGVPAPEQAGSPISRWSCPELAAQAVTEKICESISPATGASLVVPGPDQAVAVPVMDLHPRHRLCGQDSPGAGPLCPHLGRETLGRG